MKLNARDYRDLHEIVFSPHYPGYKPEVVESPNGDTKLDTQKRYAHVAQKYQHPSTWCQRLLDAYLMQAHREAVRVAKILGVPEAYTPKLEYGALRVLEYPVGAGGHLHTDFDLFTLNLYRDQPNKLVTCDKQTELNVGGTRVHMGELGELLGLGHAAPHEVLRSDTPQHSIVYFAIPDWNAVLPKWTGAGPTNTVGEWLAERLKRSRYDAPAARNPANLGGGVGIQKF